MRYALAGMRVELDDRLRAEFGVEGGWWLAVRHRLRWSEVDAFAHANHTTYLEWYEDLRIRYMAECGLPLRMETPGCVLARIAVEYLTPLRFEDEVLVTARVASFRRTSFRMDYATWRQGCVNRADGLLVMMINATGEKVPIPESAKQVMTLRDGAKFEPTA
ncbi:MAG: acyl-CoA thioesterase [Proteobacteria bacterium]|nr:acyl-CoA thioesterase [Pseudomonadota bacterium]MBI3496771.1 acyl-CoA thioesterase [Pseudomonadota bacterium]